MNPTYQLAQLNIARMLAPLDHPTMAEFVARLDEINALADHSPGFVWRLQTEAGNATDLRPFDDDRIVINMSVWKSVEALKTFVYNSRHSEVLRKRRQWFEKFTDAYFVMWWIKAGHIPRLEEAKARLRYLEQHGESRLAFTFKHPFPPPVPMTEMQQTLSGAG